MIITHNINALYVNNKLKGSVRSISKSMEKLSSGLRIGSASDDSAGLAISEKMRMQIRGLEQASRNIQDGISLVQTADGGLENILTPPLQRMRQLALQSANGTLTAEDRQNLNKEFNEMKDSIDSIANNTEFNGIKLLNFQAVDSTENSIIQKPALREINWTYVDDGDDFTAKDIVYNNDGRYVAIGFKRDNNSNDVMYNEIMYSDDAKNWTKSDFEAFPSGIIYGNGVFVATGGNGSSVGSDGGVMQSNDGINWTRIFNTSIPIDPNYFSTSQNGIAFDGSKFTMVGYDSKNGLSKTLTSTDGLNWQVYDNPDKVGSICYDGEKFVGIGYSSIYTSEDGISWTKQGNLIGYNASDSISYLGGKYFIFGEPNGNILFSDDGVNWNGVNVSNDGQIKFTSIAYDGNGYLAIGNDGMGGKTVIYNSSDGQNWDFIKELSNKGSLGTSKITWDGNEFIAADNNGFSIGIPQYDNSTNEDNNSSNRNFNMTLQVGANSDNQMKITLCDVRASTIGISHLDISSRNGAENSIVDIDKAIQLVSSHRSRMGAYENALEHTLNNVQNYGSNITASESRIRDIDMAKEMMELSKNNILSQAAQSIISQVNKQPYDVLQILRSQ